VDERDEREDDERSEPRPGFDPTTPPRPAGEGVRIIGAEEAQTALDTGQAAGRMPDDVPRYGDVPEQPVGPRPPLRFPLGGEADPASVAPKPPPSPRFGTSGNPSPNAPTAPASSPPPPTPPPPPSPSVPSPSVPSAPLPHWTEPATGEVPRILPTDEGADVEEDDLGAWSSLSGGPRWRDSDSDWHEADFAGDDELLADAPKFGALDDSEPEPDDLFDFDRDRTRVRPTRPVFDQSEAEPARRPRGRQVAIRSRRDPDDTTRGTTGGRDVGVAVGTGVAVAVVFLVCAAIGPGMLVLLAGAVITVGAAELYAALQAKGHHPATLLGLTASAALVAGAYWRGERAFPLVLAMFMVFCLLWYLTGVVRARPALNIGLSLLGFVYVGFLGSFAALLLKFPDGVGLLVGTVLVVVFYDIGAFFVGRQIGRTPLSSVSPNKTVEGLLGATSVAIAVAVVVVQAIHPWSVKHALLLALVVSVMAPLGDLCESMIKRDLDLKDMGSVLPGHGGVLDRIDAMLFVMPAVYYLVVYLKIT
jgi:phosphatidate cytidylyltransferase